MSIKEVDQIAHQIEKEPHGADSHARNLEHAYNQIEDLQKKEGFGSKQFTQDMSSLNRELHQQGILPGLDISGVNEQHQIITTDTQTHIASAQDASHVSDAGSQAGHGIEDRVMRTLANAFNIPATENDQGFKVKNPFDDPQSAAAGVIGTFLSQLTGRSDGTSSDTATNASTGTDVTPGDPLPSAVGLNSWEAQSLRGWDSPTPDDLTDDSQGS